MTRAYLLIGTYPIKSVCKGLLDWNRDTKKWRYSVSINGRPIMFPSEYASLDKARVGMQEQIAWIERKYVKGAA